MWTPVALSAAALGYGVYAACWPTAQRWGSSASQLSGAADEVALTFDDGPSNETPRFLATLEELDVKATFFVCGSNVERRPAVARAIVEGGHAIGNHTFSHPALPLCSKRRARAEISRAQESIYNATGRRTTIFRPPFGLRSPALKEIFRQSGLRGVHWSVIGFDWKWSSDRIAKRVLRHARGRSIICLHDGDRARPLANRSETLAAVRAIVPALRQRGLRFVPIEEWEVASEAQLASGASGPSTRHR